MNLSRIVLAATVLAVPVAGQPPPAPAAPETLSVSGTGRVELAPDRAVFTVGVQTMAPVVAAALQENNTRVSAIIAALKRLGAPDRGIRTSHVSIYPQQEQQGGRAPKIVGYQVSNNINVAGEPASVGTFLQAAMDAGANSVSGVSFTVSDPTRGRDVALQAAFADARAKAEVLARAAGRSVGRAVNIVEGGMGRPPVPMPYEMRAMGRSAEIPIEPGNEEVSFSVSVVFELRD